jgi:hypothetical protein
MSSDEPRHEEIEFEQRDLSAGGILGFLAGLVIVGLVLHVALLGMYKYLDHYDRTHQPPQNPLVKAAKADTRRAAPQDINEVPLPRLETNERGQLYDQRIKEEETLNSYGWVDQNAGVAHIPIDRAMQIVAQRGLPTAPPSAAGARQKPEASKITKPAGKVPAKQQ